MLNTRRSFSIMYRSCVWKPLRAKKLAIMSAEPSVKADANFAGACSVQGMPWNVNVLPTPPLTSQLRAFQHYDAHQDDDWQENGDRHKEEEDAGAHERCEVRELRR
jgi:hypothetical protein